MTEESIMSVTLHILGDGLLSMALGDSKMLSNIFINAENLCSSLVMPFIYDINKNPETISGIDFQSSDLNESSLVCICKTLLGKLSSIKELNFSNQNFTAEVTSHLCSFLNVCVSGHCPVQRLILVRCR